MTKLAMILERIWGKHREVTEDDIRNAFGHYQNVLTWLANFLVRDKEVANACVIDACTIAEIQNPVFHEWLIHWAARATVRSAFVTQREHIAELAPKYEKGSIVEVEHPPLSVEQLRAVIDSAREIQSRLDVLCRFVMVLHGIAKDSYEQVANQLGISIAAVRNGYSLAIDSLGFHDGAVSSSDAAFPRESNSPQSISRTAWQLSS